MTTRTKKSLAALGGLLLLVLVLFKAFQHPSPDATKPNSENAVSPATNVTSIEGAARGQRGGNRADMGADSNSQLPTNAITDKLQKLEVAVATKNVPIQFWGRVVDQDDKPLSGVRIVMSARKWRSIPETGTAHPRLERITDSEGKFEIEGVSGDVLSREVVEKPGYRLSPKAPNSFSYSQSPEPFTANPREPVLFRMWKIDPAEELISRRKLWGLVPDGRTYTFDLLADTKQEGEQSVGDFRVRLTRPAVIKPRDRFGWTLELRGVAGGLVESRGEFQYRAPESGYKPSITVEMVPTNADWASVLKKDFYVSSRSGGVYAVVRLEVISDYNDRSAINVDAVINPHGSRNLEPK